MSETSRWDFFLGTGEPHDGLLDLPLPPPWRASSAAEELQLPSPLLYDLEAEKDRGAPIQVNPEVRRAVNAALILRRPLLLTGNPGVGKSSLVSAVAYELRLGPVLRWSITSRSTVKNGLYEYDAVGRLYATQMKEPNTSLGDYIRLGPLGTALYPASWPRALLIDEIDKGDLDLPNDLLDVLEQGRFAIPELMRAREEKVEIRLHDLETLQPVVKGIVTTRQFPFIVMTSNGEREFPAPFLRRAVRITIPPPNPEELNRIIGTQLRKYLTSEDAQEIADLVQTFFRRSQKEQLATDQLLNAVFLMLESRQRNAPFAGAERDAVIELVLKQLTTAQAT